MININETCNKGKGEMLCIAVLRDKTCIINRGWNKEKG